MITYLTGDATKPVGIGPKIIVHVVNDMGRWGAGFVLALDKLSPKPKQRYMLTHRYRTTPFLPLGTIDVEWITNLELGVCNLVGQHGTVSITNPSPVSYAAIQHGLNRLDEWLNEWVPEGATIHMPRIGCGLAQGKWNVVESIVNETLGHRDVFVYDLEK